MVYCVLINILCRSRMGNVKQLTLFIVLIGANFLIVTKATPQIKPVLKGGRATLTCNFNVDKGKDNLVKWEKGQDVISQGSYIVKVPLKDRYQIDKPFTNENNLIIENVRETDQDVFTCKIGQTNLRQWQLVIEQKPNILDQNASPRKVNVTEGDSLTLWCNTTGKPEPRITWLRQQSDDVRAPIRDLGITGPWLLIRNVNRYDADVYICNATNKYDSALRDILVQVRFKPEIYFLPPEVQLPPNADLTLTCAIQAYPLTEAYWIDKDDRRVVSSFRYTLITTTDKYYRMTFVSIVFIKGQDDIFGTYTCHARGMEVVSKSVDVIKLTTTTPTTTTTEAGII